MEIDFTAYSLGRLQDILSLLEQAGGEMTVAQLASDLSGYIGTARADMAVATALRPGGNAAPRPGRIACPKCGAAAVKLHPVNVSRCTRVGGPWRAQAICGSCGHEEFSRLATAEIVRLGALA